MNRHRTAHAAITVGLTLTAIIVGVIAIGTLIPRDLAAFLVACWWGCCVAVIGLAYYERKVK